MSAYNVLEASVRCPSCGEIVRVHVQFKYGSTFQHRYVEGDLLKWGGNDIGKPGGRHVVVDGVSEDDCPRCGYADEWSIYVHVRSDRVTGAESAAGAWAFLDVDVPFRVLDE